MIFKNRKYFYFSEKDLTYREVKHFGLKTIVTILSSVVLMVSIIFSGNYIIYDFLNLGYDRINKIVDENKVLRSQISSLTQRFEEFKTDIDKINTQGDQLRLLVDLPKLDKDELKVGVGGSILKFDSKQILNNSENALSQINDIADKLSREINQQSESYAKVFQKYNYNQKLFAALPALKPMDGYHSTGGFGKRMHPILGFFRKHEGLDIIGDVGSPVYASGDGTVEFGGRSGGGYGIVVVINHGFGYQTLYAHLSKVLVRSGAKVKRGDLIAKSGRTGLVSGPHLHYEVHYKGVKQNPIDYFLNDLSVSEYVRNISKR
ncbi:MAG: M23 family metallopeptidase [Bacteroidota bacterium]|nr:M23 family metallopeptidase [Bacteroidota bacterium]